MDETAGPTRTEAPRRRLNRRLRAAFIEGAEEDSLRRLGRGLSDEELRRILARIPGDLRQR